MDCVISDQKLIEKGWSIYFVVDYYHLHQFAFCSSNILSEYLKYKKKMPDASERTETVKLQAALVYLFYLLEHVEQPILLPPHILELRDSIAYEQFRAAKRKLEYAAIKNWGSELFNEEEKNLIIELENWYKKQGYESKLPSNLFNKVVEISFNRFHDILYLTTGLATENLRILMNLISGENPCVQLSSKLCKSYDNLIKDVLKAPDSKWYDLFSKIRKDKIVSNKRDAKVIDIVNALNDEFINKKQKKIIYIMSDAATIDIIFNPQRYPKMKKILQNYSGITKKNLLTGEKLNILRSPRIFLLHMMASEDSYEDTIKNLRVMRDKLRAFNTTFSMTQNFIKICKKEFEKCKCTTDRKIQCEEIKSRIADQKKEHEELVSLSIIYNRYPYLTQYIRYGFKSGFDIENNIRDIATFLSGKLDKLEKMVLEKENEIQKQLDETMVTIRENIIELADEKSIEDLIYHLKRGREIPFKIEFENKKIVNHIENINEYIFQDKTKIKLEILKKYSNELFYLIEDESIGEERYLLHSILCYNFGLFELVKNITGEMISNPNITHKQDFHLVNIMATHQLAINEGDLTTYLDILKKCENAVKKYHKDPRFYYMLGVIIGRGIQTSMEKERTIDQAIDCFEKSLNLSEKLKVKDDIFDAHLHNSIAYAISLKEDFSQKELDFALTEIKNMEKLIPSENWDANFLDTKGVIYYHLGEFAIDNKTRLEFLLESKKNLTRAKDLAYSHRFFGYEKSTIKKNLKRTKDMIKKTLEKTELE